ncbi:hypothetical protein ACFFS4_31805 [Kutzneria kofuensis]|uniref:Uncharacterized protein n=1 Tax=Kutzneria kofuensis TaxID=103725 RepID=A0A7W9NGU1_9PSEU|nr:hypothetical protein [Kutzneria kofuensis]MBB5891413.1 hypothetical protein [Kutzneria kofuensis]
MPDDDPQHRAQLARLVVPNSVHFLATVLLRWLHDAHDAARRIQPYRRDDERGEWHNNVSFGTDRYQYLVRTAKSLKSEIPELAPDFSYQSMLLKLNAAALYPFRVDDGPRGPIRSTSDLRAELLSDEDEAELELLTRKEALLGSRELILLPWAGDEGKGCTGLWAGQGVVRDNLIDWYWLIELTGEAEGLGGPTATTPPQPDAPDGPALFDQPPPPLRLTPRTEQPHGTGD